MINLKIALRTYLRNKLYSSISLIGLSIGLTFFVLTTVYILDELSYDKFHTNSHRIYRVLDFRLTDGVGERLVSTVTPAAEALEEDFANYIEHSVRFFNFGSTTSPISYRSNDGVTHFNESYFYFSDPGFFNVFDLKLSTGDPQTALTQPNALVISESAARRYFGDEDPIGKVLRYQDTHDLSITGVLEDTPHNSHMKIDFLASFSTLDNPDVMATRLRNSWIWNPTWTYLLLKEGADATALEEQLPAFVQRHFPESRRDKVSLYLQPIEDVHLKSNLGGEMMPNGNMAYLYILGSLAALILIITSINYVNLAVAQSTRRAKEVGIHKTLGANRQWLLQRYLLEFVIFSIIAVLIAIPLAEWGLTYLNDYTGKQIDIRWFENPINIMLLLGFGIVVGVLSGTYPAIFLSRIETARILQGKSRINASARLRQSLILIQFSLNVILVIGAYFAFDQLKFLRSKELGFDKDQVILVPVHRSAAVQQFQSLHTELMALPGVEAVTLLEDVPGQRTNTGNFMPEGFDEPRQFQRLQTFPGIIEALGVEIIAGRTLSADLDLARREVIINEAMVKYLDWGEPEDALGRTFDRQGDEVVGVVKDFHIESLHKSISPFVFVRMGNDPRATSFFGRYLVIRFNNADLTTMLSEIGDVWQKLVTDRSFDFFFLDQEMQQLYKAEDNLTRVAVLVGTVTLILAALGLFGLASYIMSLKTREVGVRKVFGANISQITFRISRNLITLIFLAAVLATPVAYLLVKTWLADFAFRIDITLWPFVGAILFVLIVAGIAIGYQAMKTARLNPINTLRVE